MQSGCTPGGWLLSAARRLKRWRSHADNTAIYATLVRLVNAARNGNAGDVARKSQERGRATEFSRCSRRFVAGPAFKVFSQIYPRGGDRVCNFAHTNPHSHGLHHRPKARRYFCGLRIAGVPDSPGQACRWWRRKSLHSAVKAESAVQAEPCRHSVQTNAACAGPNVAH